MFIRGGPSGARVRRIALALIVLAAIVPAPGRAEAEPAWSHVVTLAAPGDTHVHVATDATGLDARAYTIPATWRNVTLVQGSHVGASPSRVQALADGSLALRYDAPLDASTPTFLIASSASTLLAPGNVTVALPGGWTHALGAFLVAGPGLPVETAALAGREATLVDATRDDHAFLARALPYLAANHGADTRALMLVRGPLPRALAQPGGVALPADADADTRAEAVARAHRSYRVVEVPPRSAAWLAEGDARLHGVLAQVAAGERAGAYADEQVVRGRAVADPDAALPSASAGSTLARQKGLVVTRALDTAIRNATDGRASLADLLARIEAEPANGTRIDSSRVEALASEVAGASLSAFFEAYVYGPAWPQAAPLPDAPDLFVTALRLAPASAVPGETVTLSYDVVNRGTRAADVQLALYVDNEVARAVATRLGVGGNTTLATTLSVAEPGAHVVRLHHREATLRVLTPGSLDIARVTTTPATPRAGEPFQLLVYLQNHGEQRASGIVEVSEAERVLQRTTRIVVEGEARHAVTLPMELADAGLHVLRVELRAEDGVKVLDADVRVAAGDAQETPWPAALALLVALAVARLRR